MNTNEQLHSLEHGTHVKEETSPEISQITQPDMQKVLVEQVEALEHIRGDISAQMYKRIQTKLQRQYEYMRSLVASEPKQVEPQAQGKKEKSLLDERYFVKRVLPSVLF